GSTGSTGSTGPVPGSSTGTQAPALHSQPLAQPGSRAHSVSAWQPVAFGSKHVREKPSHMVTPGHSSDDVHVPVGGAQMPATQTSPKLHSLFVTQPAPTWAQRPPRQRERSGQSLSSSQDT